MHVTVCIPTRIRGAAIEPTLRSIMTSTHQDYDVVIVDQSVDDETEQAIQRVVAGDSRFQYIRSRTRGVSAGLNVAIAHAAGPLVAITGHDCIVASEWVACLEHSFCEYPTVGAICGEVRPAPHDSSAGFVPSYLIPRSLLVTSAWQQRHVRGSEQNLAYRLEVLQQLGPFDEMLGAGAPFFSGEDTDIIYRILRAGHAVLHLPQAYVTHYHFHDWTDMRSYWVKYGIGDMAAYLKHLRLGDLHVLPLIITAPFLTVRWDNLARLRGPLGLRYAMGVVRGIGLCWHYPLDRRYGVYGVASGRHGVREARITPGSG